MTTVHDIRFPREIQFGERQRECLGLNTAIRYAESPCRDLYQDSQEVVVRYRELGQSGIEASVVGLGAWAIGGWMWGGTDESESIRAIHAALDAGINLIDTAPIYGFGRSEQIVGKAIHDRRERVVLATKCSMVCNPTVGYFKFRSDAAGPNPNGHIIIHIYAGPESVRKEVESSLLRLQIDHIDLLQTHWQDTTTPIAETMECLLDLKSQGKIRAIGACNATADQLGQYCQVGPFDTDQEKFSLVNRDIEQDQLPFCRENNVAVLAYSPLGRGLLTGKIGPDRQFTPGDQRAVDPMFSVENRKRVADMIALWQPLCESHNVTPAQLITAWTAAQPGLTHVLCGIRTVEQATENAAAGDLELSADELKVIDDSYGQYLAAQST